jgi:hypothetical protein
MKAFAELLVAGELRCKSETFGTVQNAPAQNVHQKIIPIHPKSNFPDSLPEGFLTCRILSVISTSLTCNLPVASFKTLV